jgi:hypothetical protein
MVIPEQGRAAGRYHLILNTLPMKKNSTDAITRVSKPPMMTSRHRALLVFIAEILGTRRVQSAGLSPKLLWEINTAPGCSGFSKKFARMPPPRCWGRASPLGAAMSLAAALWHGRLARVANVRRSDSGPLGRRAG